LEAYLKSNGYGRWKQTICLRVEIAHAEEVAIKLGVHPFKEDGQPKQAYFAWKRLTTRGGNDEDVVWDLSNLLGNPGESFDWTVDWDLSEY
jgi:hypothetical protein